MIDDLLAGGVDDAHAPCFVKMVGSDAGDGIRGDQDPEVAFGGAVDGGTGAIGVVAAGKDHRQGHVKITACAGFVTLSDELWNTAALVFPAQSTLSLKCSL